MQIPMGTGYWQLTERERERETHTAIVSCAANSAVVRIRQIRTYHLIRTGRYGNFQHNGPDTFLINL